MSQILNALKTSPRLRFSQTLGVGSGSPGRRFSRSGVARNHGTLHEGDVVHGFKVDEVKPIQEMYLRAVRLTHESTGARYLHLERDDSNNVFSINFRTTPMDSTGLPHILEHTTLCGSERYPCRDPFFKMLRRSLATFMNAMTGPDYTIYPFSTQNLRDYHNLQSVYLDLVFRPNLKESDFKQEGWRLEHADVNDKSSPVIIKGVVFNEMKGVFNENQAIFAEKLLNALLPSHTYAVISGGDPLAIPNLTHQGLVNFHSKYYHPSNSRFFSYGNFPLEESLRFVNERYLASAKRIDASMSRVPSEKRWEQPRKLHISCKPDPMAADVEKQSSIAIAYLCNDITDVQTTFELYVLSQLLLKGPTSAFYKSLVDSNIGAGFGPVTGYDSQCKDTMFVVSLQGVRPEDFEKVSRIFDETVGKVVDQGFEEQHIEAILHNIELQTKHQTSNFGLHLLFNVTPLWNHEGNVIRSLEINASVRKLRESLATDPKYLQKLVKKYLGENQHRLTLTMSPDEKYDERKAQEEEKLLRAKLEGLGENDLEKIYQEGQELLAELKKEDNPDVLPTLKISDLKKDVERYSLKDQKVAGVPLQLAVQPTNGVSYYRAILNTQDLDEEMKLLIPVFNNVAAKMGTGKYDYRSLDRMIQLHTGGLFFQSHVCERKDDVLKFEEGVVLHSYALDRNLGEMWRLWASLFNDVALQDLQRFETLVKMQAADLITGIADSGHIYAMSSSASLVSPVAKLKESISGLEFVGRMKKIAQSKNLEPVLDQVREIARRILNKEHMRSAINVAAENETNALNTLEDFYKSLEKSPSADTIITSVGNLSPQDSGIHYVFPYTVNYTSKSILTVPYTHEDYAKLRVLSKLVTSTYLHPEVREKGGAYGGGAKLSSDGVFSFYSYRDPNSLSTFDTFDKTYDFLLNHKFEERDIDEAKLGIFQQVDAPVAPSNRGMVKFTYDLTDDDIQEQRERLKSVSKDQLLEVADKYLNLRNSDKLQVGRTLIGPINSELRNNRSSENWVVLDQEEETRAQAV